MKFIVVHIPYWNALSGSGDEGEDGCSSIVASAGGGGPLYPLTFGIDSGLMPGKGNPALVTGRNPGGIVDELDAGSTPAE